MADAAIDPTTQESVVMPNGVIGTGVNGDSEALAEQFEQRHQQRTGESVEATITDTSGEPVVETPKEPRGRKRYSQLTHERDTEKARADAAEARARELEAKLSARVANPSEAVATTPAQPAVQQPTRPKPTESEIGTKYLSLSDYIEDLSDWKLEQREAKLRADFDARLDQRIEADRASRTRATTIEQAFDRGRAQYSDFDAVLKTADDVHFTPEQREVFMQLPNFEQVMYGLSKGDRAELLRIQKITNPVQLGIALAQLLPRTGPVASPASTPVAVRTTNAPAPPQPVGAGSRTAQPSLAELAASGNYAAYKARRDAERSA